MEGALNTTGLVATLLGFGVGLYFLAKRAGAHFHRFVPMTFTFPSWL